MDDETASRALVDSGMRNAAQHLSRAPFCLVDEVVLEMSCRCRGYTDLLSGELWGIMKQGTRTFQG